MYIHYMCGSHRKRNKIFRLEPSMNLVVFYTICVMCDTCQNREYSACFLEAFILFYQNVISTLLFLQMGDGNLLALNAYKYWCGVETVERMLPS